MSAGYHKTASCHTCASKTAASVCTATARQLDGLGVRITSFVTEPVTETSDPDCDCAVPLPESEVSMSVVFTKVCWMAGDLRPDLDPQATAMAIHSALGDAQEEAVP